MEVKTGWGWEKKHRYIQKRCRKLENGNWIGSQKHCGIKLTSYRKQRKKMEGRGRERGRMWVGGLKSLSKGQQEIEKSNSCATKCELQKDFVGKGVRGEDGKLSSFSQLCPSPEKSCTGQRYLNVKFWLNFSYFWGFHWPARDTWYILRSKLHTTFVKCGVWFTELKGFYKQAVNCKKKTMTVV